MKRIGRLWVAVTAVLVIGGCSNTEGKKTSGSEPPAERGAAVGPGGAGSNVKSDPEFVHDVASKNLAEIELSHMALQKSTSPEIKAFAQMMIHDHGAAADKLKTVVSGAIDWPTQLDDKYRKTADDLAKKQGLDFDRDYVEAMIEGHQDLAAKLESRLDVQSLAEWKTAAAGRTQGKALPEPKVEMTDVQVRPNKSDSGITMKINQWAADTYPVAQKHLDTARTLENATKKRSTN
jgi:putative membrane protein